MATRLVKYNGSTATYEHCSSPTLLKEGDFYEVVSKDVGECQTNYTLKGVDGYFNSVWFDNVKVGLVIATKPPKVGERFLCYASEAFAIAEKCSIIPACEGLL